MLIISDIQFLVKVFCVKSVWLLFCNLYKYPFLLTQEVCKWHRRDLADFACHKLHNSSQKYWQAAGWLAVYTVVGVKECMSTWPFFIQWMSVPWSVTMMITKLMILFLYIPVVPSYVISVSSLSLMLSVVVLLNYVMLLTSVLVSPHNYAVIS